MIEIKKFKELDTAETVTDALVVVVVVWSPPLLLVVAGQPVVVVVARKTVVVLAELLEFITIAMMETAAARKVSMHKIQIPTFLLAQPLRVVLA